MLSPTTPYVDVAPLDDPSLAASVYWLGLRFEPGNNLPPLQLEMVSGPTVSGSGPLDSQGELQYEAVDIDQPAAGVILRLWLRPDWDGWMTRDAGSDPFATIFHMFWDSPCAASQEVDLGGGNHAVIYSSYRALADPAIQECPSGRMGRFLAHAFFGDTVVTINAPYYLEPSDVPQYPSPYNSVDGMRAVSEGLRPREPVAEPTAFPTLPSNVEDPSSLVLQAADLPGRYSYGDDGCAPDRECATDPTYLGTEGGSAALAKAFGQFVAFNYQYEHTGFSDSGTPDPTSEPPTIDSYAFVCVNACDPAVIVEHSADLLGYLGFEQPREIAAQVTLGDGARIFEIDALVMGQVETGFAVVWRDGPIVALLAVGGVEGESGQQLVIGLAETQQERIERANP